MTGRHHYSIPGASFLKTRSSSKPQTQRTAATNTNVPSSSRDTRQPSTSSSRAYQYSQETAPPGRPTSAAGYRTQHSNTSVNNFHVPSSARQTHGHRSTTTPTVSASRTRLDVPDPRNYFSKMFSRKQTSAPAQGEEKRKSSQKLQRSSQAHTMTHLPVPPAQTPYHAGPSVSRAAYDASLQARDSDRDDRVRQKSKDERTKEERERMRAEYAAYRAQVQEMERVAAVTTKVAHMDRVVSRSSRDERRQQESESDNAKKRPQAQQMAQTAAQKQEARQSYYLNPAHSAVYRGTAPIRESQQSLGPQPANRLPGVPIQSSTSSQSTSASHQVHALHAPPSVARPEPNVTPNPLPVLPSIAEPAPPPPPKANSAPYQTTIHPLHNSQQQARISLSMLPLYQSSGPDDKRRLEKEAAERDALLTQDRERAEREREAGGHREVAERETAGSRERELEKRREAEKSYTDQELQERERGLERERRRARRAERERKKELDNAERERRKEHENAERERQRQAERERRAFEQQELEKQRKIDRLRQERKDSERAERYKVERERQESERMERDRLREKTERDRERASKSASIRRSHREKSYSMPTNALLGATSGSDTERMKSRKDGRHRSHSQSAVADPQHHAAPSNILRPDSKKDIIHAPGLGAMYNSAPRRDAQALPSQQSIKASTLLPSQAPHSDNANPRNASASAATTQELAPPAMPERSRTDPVLPTRESVDAVPSNQSAFEVVQSKLVSIYASQGPSDRAALRATQKMATGHPISDQRQPTNSSTASPASIAHEGYPRSSLDQPSRRTSFAQPPNATPPIGSAATSTTIPQLQHEQSALSQEILTQHPILSQSRASGDGVPGNTSPALRLPQQEKMPPTPQDQGSASLDAKYVTAAQSARQSISAAKTQLTDDRSEPLRPATNVSYGNGFSSYSQTVFGSSTDQSRIPGHNAQLAPMSRAPSNNSTKSRSVQLPPDTLADAVSGVPVSRTASDASHTLQTGERLQSAAPQAHSQSHAESSHSQRLSQLTPTTPIYSSTPKLLSTSRVKHESFTNFHGQPVLPTHSHSQSLPQQELSPTYYRSTKDDVDLSAHDNPPTARARAAIPASTLDVTHHQYPPTQVSLPQGKTTHSLSTYLPDQPQSLHATLPSSIQDHRSSSRPTMDSNNQPLYSAPTPSPDAMSQMPSTMLSYQQSLHQSSSSMYHNHSTSRNVSSQQIQHSKPVLNPARPSTQNNSNQASNAASKPPITPRSANTGVYVTSTRQAGAYSEESPSSAGGGLSLDSPPVIEPSLQHSQHDSGRLTHQHQSTYTRPQSQVGLSTPFVNGSNKPQEFTESQKFARLQETDTLPPLTPSSSRDSHEEILMTPASLGQARTHIDIKQPPDGSQRPERKKGVFQRLFRSSSTKSNKDKDRIEPREEIRRQVPGSQRDQRTESLTKSRSARPPSIMRMAEPEPDLKATIIGSTPAVNDQVKQHRASKHVPPPISIPPAESVQFRLCSSKSKRYHTMSAASMEAVDGTANNTVVGSPTSSRRSPTPSGPMTPSVRDPIEAAQAWRDNEDVFLDPGSQRRRRPGVTFDLRGDEGQKDSAVYRRVNRLHRQRRDSLRFHDRLAVR